MEYLKHPNLLMAFLKYKRLKKMPVLSFTECLFEKPVVQLMFSWKIIAALSGMERSMEFLVVFFPEISTAVLGEMFSQW